ncbi:hypothetical protein PFFVO_05471 [Plasmodium falciparum Vietnam Oak-Knoll (FVO)]|uniref:Duffy-binding-like domain-containing protein n=2 Tax=Plasmodium falciparum TaxID=5833 RepID=A0A024UYR3_PLAFA|nr:hypothetical protein PFFVO_05471 [Plasmodium falciparum Vietnam Oak-Knoll (FVO)]
MGACGSCMGKGKVQGCTSGDVDSVKKCEKCKTACDEYWNKIKPWKGQWNTMEIKYLTLYAYAQMASNNKGDMSIFGNAVGPKDKPVVQILQELLPPKSVKPGAPTPPLPSPYFTAAGYIHQEARVGECEEQKHFCNTNGNQDKYVFREKPKDHDEACACKSRPKPKKKTKEEEDPECKTVEGILAGKKGNQQVGECNPKGSYPGWDCTNNIDTNHTGACMPPRRIKLCLYYLTQLGDKVNEDEFKTAFIKTAAAEIFLSWYYYKSKHGNDAHTLDEQLNQGQIPPEFLRFMFYTYGDYRDICLNSDISKTVNDVAKAKDKIGKFFSKDGSKSPGNLSRDEWWNKHGKEIWDGMVCALTNGFKQTEKKIILDKYSYDKLKNPPNGTTPLENFAKKPQFLRWMIEWGEEFCREREKLEKNVNSECSGKNAADFCNNRKDLCYIACEEYKNYVKKKKDEFDKQNYKFVRNASELNAHKEYEGYGYKAGEKIKQGNDYLLKNCDNKKCDCMKGNVRSEDQSHTPFGKYSSTTLKLCDCARGRYVPSAPPPPAQPQPEAPQEPPAPTVQDDVCDTVKNALADMGSLTQACQQKYDGKYYGWRCVNTTGSAEGEAASSNPRVRRSAPGGEKSGDTDTTGGSICIPPRRRRLYVTPLTKWANNSGNTQSSVSPGGAASTSTSQTSLLRDAFVESAAIETFFLWDRYKKEWMAQKNKAQNGELPFTQSTSGGMSAVPGGGPQLTSKNSDDPQKKLEENGEIPEEFKRQMFYTLADYKDILFSGSNDVTSGNTACDKTNIVLEASGKENRGEMEKIQEQLKKFFKNGGSNQAISGAKNPVQTPKQWWDDNAKHIWKGMICALTYKDNSDTEAKKSDGTTNITQDQSLKTKLWDDKTKKPKKEEYQYTNVKLEEKNSGSKDTKAAASGENTPLTQFVERPPYFRYLEEWGQNFCKERKKRLDQIYKECKVGENSGKNKETPKCSCYGEHCDDQLSKNSYDTVADLQCPDCGKYCRSYRKWIETKRKEFDKQKKAYGKQKTDATSNNNGNEFSTKLQSLHDAEAFLNRLKSGPCKKDKENVKDELDFDKPNDTFRPATNCKPCSQFKIDCKKANCTGANGKECNDGKITAEKIGNGVDSTEINMLVSDNGATGFDDLNEACKDADIFKGIRKEEWKCRNECGYVVCKQEKGNGKPNGENPIITITALVTHWVQNFLEDYNKIRHKISHCKENSEQTICKKDCKDKCKCVGQWITTKKLEWENIKERFLEQYEDKSDKYFNVRSSLEKFQDQPEFKNAIKPCPNLNKFQDSKECAVAATTQNGQKRDVVVCLIEKLEKKAKNCPGKPSGEQTQEQCQHPVLDEEPLEETEENQVKAPEICPEIKKETKEEHDGTCDPATTAEETSPATDSGKETNSEQTPPLKPEEEAPSPEKLPSPPIPPLVTSTLAWSVGIGFAAFTYFYLKVNGSIYMWINIKTNLLK